MVLIVEQLRLHQVKFHLICSVDIAQTLTFEVYCSSGSANNPSNSGSVVFKMPSDCVASITAFEARRSKGDSTYAGSNSASFTISNNTTSLSTTFSFSGSYPYSNHSISGYSVVCNASDSISFNFTNYPVNWNGWFEAWVTLTPN